jgi:ABC-type sugar transport system substrate-binding protein
MSDAQLWVSIVTIGVPAVASIIAAVTAGRYASKARLAEGKAARLHALEERTAQLRREMYEPVIETLGDLMGQQTRAQAMTTMESVIVKFQNFVVVWGSDEVVTAFYRFRRASALNPPAAITIRLTAELLLAMRRDLAWPDSKITSLEVMGSRISDLQKGSELEGAFTLPFDKLAAREGWTLPW